MAAAQDGCERGCPDAAPRALGRRWWHNGRPPAPAAAGHTRDGARGGGRARGRAGARGARTSERCQAPQRAQRLPASTASRTQPGLQACGMATARPAAQLAIAPGSRAPAASASMYAVANVSPAPLVSAATTCAPRGVRAGYSYQGLVRVLQARAKRGPCSAAAHLRTGCSTPPRVRKRPDRQHSAHASTHCAAAANHRSLQPADWHAPGRPAAARTRTPPNTRGPRHPCGLGALWARLLRGQAAAGVLAGQPLVGALLAARDQPARGARRQRRHRARRPHLRLHIRQEHRRARAQRGLPRRGGEQGEEDVWELHCAVAGACWRRRGRARARAQPQAQRSPIASPKRACAAHAALCVLVNCAGEERAWRCRSALWTADAAHGQRWAAWSAGSKLGMRVAGAETRGGAPGGPRWAGAG